jgi:hypothetical protein
MIYIENYVPVVKYNGLNTALPVDFTGAATVDLPASTTVGGSSLSVLGTITSASATALAVGLNGATNSAFVVDSSTAVQAAGLKIVGAVAAGSVAAVVISSGADANLTINAKGSGTVSINATATGNITLGRATTITTGDFTVTSGDIIVTANAKKLSFTGTGANGGVLKNLKNAAASGLSGTQKDIEIDIGGVPYYFTVYPTKA